MRILLDECVNPRLRLAFPGDEVKSAAEMGWRALTNGALMREAAPRFDVLVTLDQNLQFQNQTGKYPMGIVVLITQFNHVAAYRDRKSTRLNSSHLGISYAVFCLKKKNNNNKKT